MNTKKTLYIRIDSSPLPKDSDEIIVKDFNLENYFCTLLGKTLSSVVGIDENIRYPGELFTDFFKFNEDDYHYIVQQWEKAIPYLINQMHDENYSLTIQLPESYRNWLCQHENIIFQEVGNNLSMSHLSVPCDTEYFYNEIIENSLLKKITLFLKKNIEEIECITLPFLLYSGNCIEDICMELESLLYIRNGWGDYTFNTCIIGEVEYDFHEGFARCCNSGWWSYIDKQGEDCLYSYSNGIFEARDFSDGLAAIRRGNKWGFINKEGENIIPCKYEEVDDFSAGVACVKFNGKWGFVNKQGLEIIECKFDFAANFVGYPAPLELALVEDDSGLSFIYKDGSTHIYCDFYDTYSSFSEGFARVKLNNKYGFINLLGEEQIPCKYEETRGFSEGIACVKYMNKWGYINKDGQAITPCIYDEAYSLTEGLALVCKRGKYGYINKKGVEVIPFIYEDGCTFSEGLACVMKGDKWGYVDKNNREIIPFIYNDAFPFSDGMARVQLHSGNSYDYINKHWFVK